MQKTKHAPIAAKPRPGLSHEQRMQLTQKYMSDPNGPMGVQHEAKLRNVCLHCGSFGTPYQQVFNSLQLWCEACTVLSLNNPAIKHNIWYTNHCSNHECVALIDSRDPQIVQCECGGYICSKCGSCKATCRFR